MSDFTVSQSAAETRGRFSLERDGRPVGEMTYSRAGDDLIIVDHTETFGSSSFMYAALYAPCQLRGRTAGGPSSKPSGVGTASGL